jgi:hypothetical protein
MSRRYTVFVLTLHFLFLFIASVVAQNPPASDPQALLYAAQSIASVSGRAKIVDATLTGTITWNGSEAGNATLRVLNTGKSRIDLQLTAGTRSEMRGEQNGQSMGRWTTALSTRGNLGGAQPTCQGQPAAGDPEIEDRSAEDRTPGLPLIWSAHSCVADTP